MSFKGEKERAFFLCSWAGRNYTKILVVLYIYKTEEGEKRKKKKKKVEKEWVLERERWK